jgi:tRNA nucleotidyltransferase (CCA-adding enzyme)
MPDYMYMLESRLSPEQRAALLRVQELATQSAMNVYLTGGAVRDLISGMTIRDLDFTVEGNPLRLVRELEKGGARVVEEDEKLRTADLMFAGEVDGSISAARDEVYLRPGTRPEIRWSTIMEDLHRRDFSLNAIALSLNPASRGLLLDPTNGLSDLENREVRALSIHSFTNHPARLLRALRYAARMDFKIAPRTEEWFALAIERGLHEQIPPEEVGKELRQLMREDKPTQILKGWESRGLMGAIHAQLAKRHPDYEMLGRILKARDDLASAGLHPRLAVPVGYATLAKLKDRERASLLEHVGFRAPEVEAIAHFESEVQKAAKGLTGHATEDSAQAFNYLEKTPGAQLVFLLAEGKNAGVVSKIRNYLHKWRPLRQALPAAILELESLGMPRGPKFDAVIEEFFRAQLHGKAKTPEDRPKILRKLAGIKEPPKKKPEEPEKKKRGEKLSKQAAEKASAKGAPPAAAPQPGKPPVKPGKPGHAAAHHPAPPAKGAKPAMAGKKPVARSKS